MLSPSSAGAKTNDELAGSSTRDRPFLLTEVSDHEVLTMAQKFVGYDKVVETKTRGQPAGKILVKLRRQNQPPRWQLMSLKDYERRAVIRK